ncbi:hypothetical protein [Niabella beijingensis]|uniref:hypothetical protein n=1 Tax=Niabella beijingensis TaxID=2872700 RepID=UPI001CC092D5|nr:hypothetical protein [Niabella beijingensis]
MDTVNEPATAYKNEHDTIAEYLEMERHHRKSTNTIWEPFLLRLVQGEDII